MPARYKTVAEVAAELHVCENTARKYFEKEPGVLRLAMPSGAGKRPKSFLRIPDHVVERFRRKTDVSRMIR